MSRRGIPFAAAEAERVGQLAAQSSPELFALLALGHNVQVVVQPLKLLVVLGHFGVRLALRRPSSIAASTALALVLAPILLVCQSLLMFNGLAPLTPLFPRGMVDIPENLEYFIFNVTKREIEALPQMHGPLFSLALAPFYNSNSLISTYSFIQVTYHRHRCCRATRIGRRSARKTWYEQNTLTNYSGKGVYYLGIK